MKKHLFLSSVCLFALNLSAQYFTVKATITSIQKGCEVKLVSAEGRQREVATAITDENGFQLTGQIDRPMVVKLRINDKPSYAEGEFPKDRSVSFMLAEGTTTVSADDFSQMPLNYEFGNTPLKKERNVKIEGGTAQQHYQEWRDYIHDAELAAWQTGHVVWKARFGKEYQSKSEPAALSEMEAAEQTAQTMVNAMNNAFIKDHPTYAISLILQRQQLENMFAYTNDELNQMVSLFKDNEDRAGYLALCQQIEELRHFTKGTPYTDLTLELPDGTQKHLSDYIVKGKLNFIDFWASWCGPCRMAIPSVKEMHQKLGDKVNILSLSVDTSKDAWKKAMDEEQMPWTQLLVPKTSTKAMTDAYRVRAIPYLMIIDGEGRVLFSTHDADKAHEMIKKLIN